mmetsp:Transcript_12905/g.38429  ORF Transcript_12905/g.38429 Transcript_12905/m.38429 type:complete len:271 (-) Transcript_12905:1328-2140(-)
MKRSAAPVLEPSAWKSWPSLPSAWSLAVCSRALRATSAAAPILMTGFFTLGTLAFLSFCGFSASGASAPPSAARARLASRLRALASARFATSASASGCTSSSSGQAATRSCFSKGPYSAWRPAAPISATAASESSQPDVRATTKGRDPSSAAPVTGQAANGAPSPCTYSLCSLGGGANLTSTRSRRPRMCAKRSGSSFAEMASSMGSLLKSWPSWSATTGARRSSFDSAQLRTRAARRRAVKSPRSASPPVVPAPWFWPVAQPPLAWCEP